MSSDPDARLECPGTQDTTGTTTQRAAWGHLMNGLQVFPNIVGLLGLSGVVVAAARGTRKTTTNPIASSRPKSGTHRTPVEPTTFPT